jgi:hypothetical protein
VYKCPPPITRSRTTHEGPPVFRALPMRMLYAVFKQQKRSNNLAVTIDSERRASRFRYHELSAPIAQVVSIAKYIAVQTKEMPPHSVSSTLVVSPSVRLFLAQHRQPTAHRPQNKQIRTATRVFVFCLTLVARSEGGRGAHPNVPFCFEALPVWHNGPDTQ